MIAKNLGTMQIILGADDKRFKDVMTKSERRIARFARADLNKLAGYAKTALIGVAGAFAYVGASAVRSAAQYEQQRIAFTTLLKSGSKAEAFLKNLSKIAADTPFEFNQLVDASRKIMAFGFEAEKVEGILRTVGDAASGLGLQGDGIDRIVRALGQMQAKGKVSAQEMNQLAETGANAWKYLADASGKSIAETMKAAEKGLLQSGPAIQQILSGMDKQFGGMMKRQSETLTGMWSTVVDNASTILRELGGSMATELPLGDTLRYARDELGKFASLVQDAGFTNAMDLVFAKYFSNETIAIISGIGAAMTTTLIPSMWMAVKAAGAFALANLWLVGLAAAVGTLVYAFQNLDTIYFHVGNLWERIKFLFKDGKTFMGEVLNSVVMVLGQLAARVMAELVNIVSGGLQIVVDAIRDKLPGFMSGIPNALQAVVDKSNDLYDLMMKKSDEYAQNAQDAFHRVGYALQKNDNDLKKSLDQRKKAYDEQMAKQEQVAKFHEAERRYGKQIAAAFEDAKSRIVAAYESIRSVGTDAWSAATLAADNFTLKIFDVINAVSKAVGWLIQLRGVFGMADIKPAESPVAPTSPKKSGGGGGGGKSTADEARDALELYRTTFREMRDLKQELVERPTGSAGWLFDLQTEIEGVRDRWSDALDGISDKFSEAGAKSKEAILKALNEAGIAYQVASNGQLDLTRQRNQTELAMFQETERRKAEYLRSGRALEDDLQAAYDAADLQRYTTLLTSKQAAFLAHLDGQRAAMDQYRQFMLEANRSDLSYLTEAAQTISSGLTDAIVGIATGTKKASEAFRELGKQIIAMIVRWMVQRAVSAAMAKTLETGMATSSAAAASVVNAAWAPAAAKVAIATMGGAIGPAMAGLIGATSSYRALSAVGLAEGGVVSRPTYAMIGEGTYPEAVIPLNDRVLSKMGGGSRPGSVEVRVINQSGVPVKGRADAQFDGQRMVVEVVLDALERNVMNLRDQVAAVKG